MKRTLVAAFTCLALTFSTMPARAAEGDLLPGVNAYPGYVDVRENDWFYDTAVLCYETGLMTGTAAGFEPYRELTVAEAAVIAARLREAVSGEAIPVPIPDPSLPWYQHYVDYLQNAVAQSTSSYYGIIDWDSLSELATRDDFLVFLALAVDGHQKEFPTINAIASLPDIPYDNVVLFFYNAGIMTGTDKYGTFAPDKTLTRAEAAAMAARIVRPSLRRSFVPADYTLFTAAGLAPSDVLFTNGATSERYLDAVLSRILALDAACAEEGIEFNWFHTMDGKTFLDDVKHGALDTLGVTEDQGTPAYEAFDVQVFYSRYLDLTQ